MKSPPVEVSTFSVYGGDYWFEMKKTYRGVCIVEVNSSNLRSLLFISAWSDQLEATFAAVSIKR